MRLHHLPRASLALLALTFFAASSAFAADKPKKEIGFGTGKPTGGVLTRDQLRACLLQKDQVAQQEAALPKEKDGVAATHDEIARSGETLKAALEALDRTDEKAVASYNEQTQARDKQIDEYQARVNAFNSRVEAAKTAREAFAKACGNRSYFEEDEAAIKRGK